MGTEEETTVVLRDDAEREAWWKMMLTVSTSDSLVFDEAVKWADDSIRALRNRSTPDLDVTPAEANDLYAAGYRPSADSWAKAADSTGSTIFGYNGLEKAWIKIGPGRRTLHAAKWDPAVQSLATFLRESEAAT